MKDCSVSSCIYKGKLLKGYCPKHYKRLYKYGDPEAPRKKPARVPVESRFWGKVDQTSDCWGWLAYRNRHGYGVFTVEGRTVLAHRFSYTLAYGEILSGYQVDHICHNRSCVNPEHLRAVTPRQNSENLVYERKNNTSGHRNVHWDKNTGKWIASICSNGEKIYGGSFENILDAAQTASELRNRHHSVQLVSNNLSKDAFENGN